MQGKPRPSATAEEALSRMDQFVALGIVGQQEVAQRLGLNVTDLTCLGHILGAGENPLAAGDLAELVDITTGAVTGVLNRLERAGYARRQTDPADRRRVRVVAEPAAAARVFAVYQPSTTGSEPLRRLHPRRGGRDRRLVRARRRRGARPLRPGALRRTGRPAAGPAGTMGG